MPKPGGSAPSGCGCLRLRRRDTSRIASVRSTRHRPLIGHTSAIRPLHSFLLRYLRRRLPGVAHAASRPDLRRYASADDNVASPVSTTPAPDTTTDFIAAAVTERSAATSPSSTDSSAAFEDFRYGISGPARSGRFIGDRVPDRLERPTRRWSTKLSSQLPQSRRHFGLPDSAMRFHHDQRCATCRGSAGLKLPVHWQSNFDAVHIEDNELLARHSRI